MPRPALIGRKCQEMPRTHSRLLWSTGGAVKCMARLAWRPLFSFFPFSFSIADFTVFKASICEAGRQSTWYFVDGDCCPCTRSHLEKVRIETWHDLDLPESCSCLSAKAFVSRLEGVKVMFDLGRVDHIWTWLSEHRDQVEGYAVVDDMDLSLDSTSQ